MRQLGYVYAGLVYVIQRRLWHARAAMALGVISGLVM